MKYLRSLFLIAICVMEVNCASTQKGDTSDIKNATPIAPALIPKIPCPYDKSADEPIYLNCENGIYSLVLKLDQVKFKGASAAVSAAVLGTNFSDVTKLILVGDFKPFWREGKPAEIKGAEAWFPLQVFLPYNESHRLQVRVKDEEIWLVLEDLTGQAELVTDGMDQSGATVCCIGIWVENKEIKPFSVVKPGELIMPRPGLVGKIKFKTN